jgi:hypothetical protein
VYEGNANWVPPLISDMEFILGEKNPFFHHAEAACFLAKEGENVVGRIAAIIDRNHINTHNEQAGFFGFFECLPDPAIAGGLLDSASAWLKERDIEIMRGPMNPSTNDECGFLLEGFDSPPMIMMTYTPPYYLDYMERCGMVKSKDLYAYLSIIKDVSAGERLERLAAGVRSRVPGLTVRPANMKDFAHELAIVKEIYNSAWSHNWGAPDGRGERRSGGILYGGAGLQPGPPPGQRQARPDRDHEIPVVCTEDQRHSRPDHGREGGIPEKGDRRPSLSRVLQGSEQKRLCAGGDVLDP